MEAATDSTGQNETELYDAYGGFPGEIVTF